MLPTGGKSAVNDLEVPFMPRLTVQGEDVVVDCLEGETVLEALYRNGYAYRVGCRRGGCAICKVDIVEGQVEYNRPVSSNVLSAEEIMAGSCLSCRAVPVGDLQIALRDENLRRVGTLLNFFEKSGVRANLARTP